MPGQVHQARTQECWDEVHEMAAALGTAPPPGVSLDDVEVRREWLIRAVEAEVVPRLVLSRKDAPTMAQPASHTAHWIPSTEEISTFARLVVAQEASAACAHVDALRDRGVSCETLCLHLLAPAARHLGELWSEDVCDFSEVTIGLWHLHQVLHHLHPALPDYDTVRSTRRRAVLVPLPGEQHSFGAMMVAEFFRRAGWSVWSGPFADNDDLLGLVAGEWFGMVGLSAAGEIRFAGLSQLIRAIRRVSRNRSVRIMVGGPLFNAQPDLACRVGADATATDGRIAVARAERMLALRPAESAGAQDVGT